MYHVARTPPQFAPVAAIPSCAEVPAGVLYSLEAHETWVRPSYVNPAFCSGTTVTPAEPDLVASATEVALIVADPAAPGAVKRPLAETEPADALQFTALLKLPVPCTAAEH